jgi:phage shock protein C
MVILAIGGGSGVLIYIVAWLIIPAQRPDEVVGEGVTSLGSRGPMIAGVALIGLGFMLLVDVLVPWFDRVMWPMALVAAGVVLLSMGVRRDA